MPPWTRLLERAVAGLAAMDAAGQPVPDWVLGGGTALMLHADHRLSRDIDAFITDPQYLAYLSPDGGGEDIWGAHTFDRTAHYLKLVYPEGEIDFIVAPALTALPVIDRDVAGIGIRLEHPVEIAIKKMHFRGAQLKVRDVFDIAVVDAVHSDLLEAHLPVVTDRKAAILSRLSSIPSAYAAAELAELDIRPHWEDVALRCMDLMGAVARRIPD
ncbi:nucleotidyl transferase AbiEii/AbiGii toxin family protein [Methylobacterium sp. NEAU 140]|uniref:nucleotidyl transferase AbiEii/AbiGii toxin family protein n=1 Tax=Methylobacterium sp. NEAU 140 TaxID=3064945 RepID=UPI00273641A7|nr:nucleotidyl transferase AbiEii/AbiGii toxin family protein [Methylobacterium sp. NEAU 140]MDP4025080.1 nucleotidyl transferase AbiEii/AbiGii toxin family protein [Methylobacterium sp. NEAU 140]